jgi:hypothetical protein
MITGQDLATRAHDPKLAAGAGLRRGAAAENWMHQESERLSRFVRDELRADAAGSQGAFMADGGAFLHNLAPHLDREGLLHLFNAFFAPQRDWDPATGGM